MNNIGRHIREIKLTAYTHNEKDHLQYKRLTANGTQLQPKQSIASDWSVFPVDTVLEIEGRKYTVDDYGSALVKADYSKTLPVIDIYVPSFREMNRFGSKVTGDIKVVQMGSWERSLDILAERRKFSHCDVMYRRIEEKINQ